jgi:uncharacterized protein (TIGR00255 family)
MVLSMTGYGAAAAEDSGVSIRVEIRCVNNRYFKATMKTPEVYQRFDSDVERLLREELGRGSVTCTVRIRDDKAGSAYEINTAAVAEYVNQLAEVARKHPGTQIDLGSLLEAPGVCEPAEIDESLLGRRFTAVQRVLKEAIGKLMEMRRAEGAALLKDLQEQCADIRKRIAEIAKRCPKIVEDYHGRLTQRVQQLLSGGTVQLDKEVLAKEVAIFAERCDVNEEISRLTSHLDQFKDLCDSSDDVGRKLDFLAQEMLREANTIGSKASDTQVARHIVEIKAAIDRIKEQVQNVA